MKCPQCIKEGTTSKLYYEYGTSTSMIGNAYYDEEGKYHNHDPNEQSDVYHCSNGHHIVVGTLKGCRSCGTKDQIRVE